MPKQLLNKKAQGIFDGIVQDVVLSAIIAVIIQLFPWLGSAWAAPILSWIVKYWISPIFKALQDQYNIIFIDWEVMEQDKEYMEEVKKMREIVDKIINGELKEDDQEVIDARNSFKDKLRDLIRIKSRMPKGSNQRL